MSDALPSSKLISIYIDADAYPVEREIYRVAERHALKGTALKVFVVTNSPIAVPRDPLIKRGVTLATRNLMDSLRRRRRNMDTFADSSVTSAIADKDNTTRRGPAVCRAAAAEDCRMSRTSRRSARRARRHRARCPPWASARG
jgi:hypothetical protein